jgi:hypothetical protein
MKLSSSAALASELLPINKKYDKGFISQIKTKSMNRIAIILKFKDDL